MGVSRLSLLVRILTLLCVHLTVGAADCTYGKYTNLAAASCREIQDVQPDCGTGYYWVDDGVNVFLAYCDMDHQGGGWQRVFNHRPGNAKNCPNGWKNTWVNEGATLYCQRGPPSEGYVPYRRVNENGRISYSEVRGYVLLRVQEGTTPDGFSDDLDASLDSEYMDGFAIELLDHPDLPPRHIFSYVIGRPDPWYRCPVNGVSYVSRHPQALPPFWEYSYACDEVEVDTADVDGNGYYIRDLHYPENRNCIMCPEGMPWFQVDFGEVVNKTLQFRFVDGRSADYGISMQWMDIFVR